MAQASAAPASHVEAAALFDRIAERYRDHVDGAVLDSSSVGFRRRQDIVLRMLAETPRGGTVLDFGMGPAVFGPAVATNGGKYIGIDISPRMVAMAKAMELPDSEMIVGDLGALAPYTRKADTVLLIGLVDYLEEPVDGLRRLASCVKPGGRMILSFRNHRSVPRVLRSMARGLWRLGSDGVGSTSAFAAQVHERSFVPGRDLAPLLREQGFSGTRVEYLDCSPVFFKVPLPAPVWRAWRRADEIVAKPAVSFLCASGVMVAHGMR
jgi:SAM-dependent methyltransferase